MQLKFRVYDPMVKKMSFFDIRQASFQIADDIVDNVQQFSGIKDVDGCEIYEGDIVHRYASVGNLKGVCEYSIDEGSYILRYHWGDFIYLTDFPSIRVIGNIFENPDLLLTNH